MVYDWVYQLALPAKHHGLSNQNLSNVFNVVNSIMIIIIYNYHISLLLSTSVVTACHPHKYHVLKTHKYDVFKPLQIIASWLRILQFGLWQIPGSHPDHVWLATRKRLFPSGGQPDIFSAYSSKVMLEMLRKWKYFVSWESWMPVVMPCLPICLSFRMANQIIRLSTWFS